jgi:hypothetical protein
MKFIELILDNNLIEAKKIFDKVMSEKTSDILKKLKEEISVEVFGEENIVEAIKRNPNIIKMGRIQKIRRRIRRNAKGRIVVQKNRRRSGVKGYKIQGNRVVRIPAVARLRKARLLKRSWKTTRRAKLRRSLLKRKMSMRRRTSLGLR